jgi:hypothetical protein
VKQRTVNGSSQSAMVVSAGFGRIVGWSCFYLFEQSQDVLCNIAL